MPGSMRVPRRLPVGTKYVLENDGLLVRRFIEFPNGRKTHLARRKALICTYGALGPDQHRAASNQSRRRSSVAAFA
jgi:hypothetical protein